MTAAPAARVGYLMVAGAALCWSLLGVLTRELVESGLTAREIGCARAVVAASAFVVHRLVARLLHGREGRVVRDGRVGRDGRGGRGGRGGNDTSVAPPDAPLTTRWTLPSLGAFCAVGVVVYFVALPEAIARGGVTLAFVLLYTAPAMVAVGAPLFVGEARRASTVVLAGLTVVGAAAISASGGHLRGGGAAVAWGLTAAVGYASYYLLGRRLFGAIGPLRVWTTVLPVGAAVLVAIVRPPWPTWRQGFLVVIAGVVSTYLPFRLLSSALTMVPSSRASMVATLEPVLASVLAMIVYGERLDALGYLGGLLVLGVAVVAAGTPPPAVAAQQPAAKGQSTA